MRWHYWLWLLLAILYGFTAYHVFKRQEPPEHPRLHFEDLTLRERMALCGLHPDDIYDFIMDEQEEEE